MIASICDLSTDLRRVPLPRPWGPDVAQVHLIITTVKDHDGNCGTGFSWTPSIGAHAVRALLDHDIRAAVVGQPADPRVLWQRLWWHLHEGGGGGLTTIAMAGIDIALWDLRARTVGLSLVDLLGRRHERATVYGSGVNLHYSLEELQAQAERWVAAGFGAVKMKVGRPEIADDMARVAAVREIIGPGRRLMVDANQRWDLPTARRAIRALAEYDLAWVEEPLPADDLPAHADLRRAVEVPIAIGENLFTAYQFRDALRLGACDILQPNVVRVGGITPFLRIADLARLHDVQLVPHLLPDLSGQLALCLERATAVEDVEDASFSVLGVLERPAVTIEDGHLTSETGPGHGLVFK